MKKSTKILLLLACAVLLVSASVMGTVAYLTSSESVENTFTVGNIAIKLDETTVDADGKPVADAPRTEDGNKDVELMPGREITKDPTVWVKEGSEPAYIRMKVTLSNYSQLKEVFGDDFLPQNYVSDWDGTTWVSTNTVAEDTVNNTATYEFWYKEIYTAPADNEDEVVDYTALTPLFKTFTLPGEEVDSTDLPKLEGLTITVVANAIQAEGFTDAAAAWKAFDGKA